MYMLFCSWRGNSPCPHKSPNPPPGLWLWWRNSQDPCKPGAASMKTC